jgi:hypothetical protein
MQTYSLRRESLLDELLSDEEVATCIQGISSLEVPRELVRPGGVVMRPAELLGIA